MNDDAIFARSNLLTGPKANFAERPLISIVLKCFNEEAHLDRCIQSLLIEVQDYDAEIIVADSLSTDRSVEVAGSYPVRIVQMADPGDRRCGAAAQLGYQFAHGRFVLLIDGDMELMPGFLPEALMALEADPGLSAVGGTLIEMSERIEFQERQARLKRNRNLPLTCITGCGLYRAEAIADVGYFMNRNLHCCEEYELGVRLRSKGWRLHMLATPCVRHHGHSDAALTLLARRWRIRFFHGYGELLRSAWWTPVFAELIRPCRIAILVIGWWSVLWWLGLASLRWHDLLWALLAVAALPMAALFIRKRNISRAFYAFAAWQFAAAALIAGLFSSQSDPRTPLAATVLKD